MFSPYEFIQAVSSEKLQCKEQILAAHSTTTDRLSPKVEGLKKNRRVDLFNLTTKPSR